MINKLGVKKIIMINKFIFFKVKYQPIHDMLLNLQQGKTLSYKFDIETKLIASLQPGVGTLLELELQ